MNRTSVQTFKNHPIISDQVGQGELSVVWRELEKVLAAGVPGDIVEFGCYAGTTSLFIRRLLDEKGESNQHHSETIFQLPSAPSSSKNFPSLVTTSTDVHPHAGKFLNRRSSQLGAKKQSPSGARSFHVYDSFQGLPEKTGQDKSVVGEQFKAGELSVSKKTLLQNFRAANLQPPIIHKGWFSQLAEKDVPEQIAFAFLDGDFYDSIMDSLKLVWPHMAKGGAVLVDDYGREALPGAERAVRDFFGNKSPAIHHEHNIAIINT